MCIVDGPWGVSRTLYENNWRFTVYRLVSTHKVLVNEKTWADIFLLQIYLYLSLVNLQLFY